MDGAGADEVGIPVSIRHVVAMLELVTMWSRCSVVPLVASLGVVMSLGCDGPSTSPSALDSPNGSVSVTRFADGGFVMPDFGGDPFVMLQPVASPHAMDDVIGHEWGARVPLEALADRESIDRQREAGETRAGRFDDTRALDEIINPQRRRETRRAAGGQHVARPGGVIAERLGRILA